MSFFQILFFIIEINYNKLPSISMSKNHQHHEYYTQFLFSELILRKYTFDSYCVAFWSLN